MRQAGRAAPPLPQGEIPPKKVAWLHPPELLRTAYHVWLANVATEYLDRRETLAAINRTTSPEDPDDENLPGNPDHAAERERRSIKLRRGRFIDAFITSASTERRNDGVWLDFVADIGDSWQATYAVATMLAQPALEVRGSDGRLRCADIVALGGDLVYPSPTRDGYRRRTFSALGAALPEQDVVKRTIVAIPGNHDWYDGLMNFVRSFCQGGFLGGWRFVQRRSYYAVKLMPGWWLWGIDVALDTRIDPPQQAYFLNILSGRVPEPEREDDPDTFRPDDQRFRQGDNIILSTAKPSWLDLSRYSNDASRNLVFFVQEIIERHGGHVPIILTGDLHHYYRYEDRRGRHMIISGGGGGYLMGTHSMPARVLTPAEDGRPGSDDAKTLEAGQFPYPSHVDSRRIALGAVLLAFRQANWLFSWLIGVLYLSLVASLRHGVPSAAQQSLWSLMKALPTIRAISTIWLVATIISACVVFAVAANWRSSRLPTALWGLAHAFVHLAWAVVLVRLASPFSNAAVPVQMRILNDLSFSVLAGVAGATLFGAYLSSSDRLFRWHTNEVFASQSIIDYRNFVRMHIRTDGALDLFAIGLRRVPRKWQSRTDRKRGSGPYYEPVDDVVAPHLIEGPVRIHALK